MARYFAQFERATPAVDKPIGSVGSSSSLHRRGAVESLAFGSKAPGGALPYPAGIGSRYGIGFRTPVVGAVVPLIVGTVVEEA